MGVTASAACAACAAVLAETWLEDAREDAAGDEGDDAGMGTLEMMLRQRWRLAAAAGALYATYMYYHTDIVGADT